MNKQSIIKRQFLFPFIIIFSILIKYLRNHMIDFSRTFCHLHPNELLSNFCSKKECLIGLCATCICQHTQQHMQNKTVPEYENIRTTYSNIQEAIRQRITALEHEKNRIAQNNISEIILNKRKQVGVAVEQAKNDTIEFVNSFYQNKHKEILRKIEADEKKLGLHNESRMDSLLNLISRDLTSLFASAQELNSHNFIQSYQRVRMQVIENSCETQKEISLELDKNQNYETLLSLNSMYISDVKIALENSLNVIFNENKATPQPVRNAIMTAPKIVRNVSPQQQQQQNMADSTHYQSQHQTNPNMRPMKAMEEISKHSRIHMMDSANGNNMPRRMTESQPKVASHPFSNIPPNYNHHSRYISGIIPQQPQQYLNPQFHSRRDTPQQQQSFPINNPQLLQSKIEVRPSSTQKNMKENISTKYFGNASFTEITTPNSQSQLSLNNVDSKKIRKSGITMLKNIDNDCRTSQGGN